MPHSEDRQRRMLKYIQFNRLLPSARQRLSPNRAVKNTVRHANKFSHTWDGGWSSHRSTVFDVITRKAQHSIWNPQRAWREPVPRQKIDTRIGYEDWDADLKSFSLVSILRTKLPRMLIKYNGREPVPNPFCALEKRQPFRQILFILTLTEKWWQGAMSEKVTTLVKSDIGFF